MTINDLLRANGFKEEYLSHMPLEHQRAYEFFREWSVDGVCGVQCHKIIPIAKPFLEAVDPAARPHVWGAIIAAMTIICVG